MTASTFFERVDAARVLHGHSPREACDQIGVSLPSWYRWRNGSDPRKLQREAAERYIDAVGSQGAVENET